ncbi:unnamed protein product [Diamesa serratosioi]
MENSSSNAFLSADWLQNDDNLLDSIFSMETDALLSAADFGTQEHDMINDEQIFKGFDDLPAFDHLSQFKDEPMFSSADSVASDSGLSSDNLDIDIHNDFDALSSCLSSPASSDNQQDSIPNLPVKVERIGHEKNKASTNMNESTRFVSKRNIKNTNKIGSLMINNKYNNNNNKNKKGEQKILHLKNGNSKSRSIIVPVSSQKDFSTIKIVNSCSASMKANMKAAATNLLQKSKAGLLQKNIFIPKRELIQEDSDDDDDDDEDDELTFDEVMQETNNVLAAHDSDDLSSAESCSSGYPKLLLTNEEKRLLSKEGISLPASYPLTKHEERELKRIRRKIRNKISAQDSRKRKKEYIDGLEERVKLCSDENQHLMKRIKVLQNQNHDLMSKMKKLQTLLTKSTSKTAQPSTCLMILVLSMALVALPNLKLTKEVMNSSELSAVIGEQQKSRNLLFTDLMSDIDDVDSIGDEQLIYSSIPNEHDYVENVYKYVNQLSEATPPKRVKSLVDYDIEWEINKRASEPAIATVVAGERTVHPKITVSKDLFDIGAKTIETFANTIHHNATFNNKSDLHLQGIGNGLPDQLLAKSFLNIATTTLQKSNTA